MTGKQKLSSSLILFLFITSSISFSNSVAQFEEEEVIIYAMPYDYNEYSVYTANSYATAQWIQAVYAGLVKRSAEANYQFVPDLVKEMPTVSENELTFTFILKENLKFSNGEDLTVEDVEFSIKASVTPDINTADYSAYSNFFNNNSLTQISSTQFSITIKEKFAFVYSLFTFPIVPKETFGERYENCLDGVVADCSWNSEDGSDAISAGPFMTASIDNTNEIVTLVSNPYYYNFASVTTNKIQFQKIAEKNAAISALNDGSIHILDSQYVPGINELSDIPNIIDNTTGDPATQEISINHHHPYIGTGEAIPGNELATELEKWEDARLVRNAMSYLINRSWVVEEVLGGLGQPAATNMPAASIGWDPEVLPDQFNLDQAKSLMQQAGFDFGTLGTPNADGIYPKSFFNITILHPNSRRGNFGPTYADLLPKIGIGVKDFVVTGWAEIIPRTFGSEIDPPVYDGGGFDVFFIGYSWSLDWNPAGLYDASGSCSTGSCSNYYNFDLFENLTNMAELVNLYLNELDFDQRIQHVQQIQALIAHTKPMIPIFYPSSHWAYRDDISGIDLKLFSMSSMEWDLIGRAHFKPNGTLEPNGSDDDSHFDGIVFLYGLVIIVHFQRKRTSAT